MKKILLTFIFGLSCMWIMPASVKAAEAVEVDGLWYEVASSYAHIVASPDKEFVYAANLMIPGKVTINGESLWVAAIYPNAFEGVQEIKSLSFDPNGYCKEIGKEAFKNSGVETVIIDSGVYTIGESAFEGSALKSVVFKKRFQSSMGEVNEIDFLKIGNRAFADTKNLKSIESEQNFEGLDFNVDWNYPDNYFPNLSSGVFAGSGLESITLYPALGGPEMFKDCASLKEVKFGEDKSGIMYTIYPQQFCGTAIEDLSFPKEATTIIGELSFANISGLRSVTIPGSYYAVLGHIDGDVREDHEMGIYEQVGCFLNSGSDATLYLSKELYDKDAQYRVSLYGFKDVKMIGEAGVQSVEARDVRVEVQPGAVTVNCSAGSQVVAVGLNGIAVHGESAGGSCHLELTPGVYVITVDGMPVGKVIVP